MRHGRQRTQTSPRGTYTSAYDLAGRRTRLTHPGGFFIQYSHLVPGELSQLNEWNWQPRERQQRKVPVFRPGLDPGSGPLLLPREDVPRLGRFMQTDPIGYGDAMNMYAYVGGDPINATDPSATCGMNSAASRLCEWGHGYGVSTNDFCETPAPALMILTDEGGGGSVGTSRGRGTGVGNSWFFQSGGRATPQPRIQGGLPGPHSRQPQRDTACRTNGESSRAYVDSRQHYQSEVQRYFAERPLPVMKFDREYPSATAIFIGTGSCLLSGLTVGMSATLAAAFRVGGCGVAAWNIPGFIIPDQRRRP